MPDKDRQSICFHCIHLEEGGNVVEGVKYNCLKRYPKHSAFGKWGKDVKEGVPMVKVCNVYFAGRHYSRKER